MVADILLWSLCRWPLVFIFFCSKAFVTVPSGGFHVGDLMPTDEVLSKGVLTMKLNCCIFNCIHIKYTFNAILYYE